MSTGIFLNANYEDNKGDVHAIRIQPETASLVIGGVGNAIPALPAGGLVQPVAQVSGGKNQRGLTARRIGIRLTAASPEGGYLERGTHYVPWLAPATFPDPALKETGIYNGNACVVIGSSPERSR